MRRVAAVLVCLVALVALARDAAAQATPAPQPPGWPSDVCYAEGSNIDNPTCGTCSTSVVYSTPELGTYIGWVCKHADGKWLTHELTRPWMARWIKPAGPGLAAMWASNVVIATPEDTAKYATLVALARPHLANVWKPPEAPAPDWVVKPVSTMRRPSFLAGPDGVAVPERGQSIPTGTAVAPTVCACEDPRDQLMQGLSKLCRVPNFTTTSGQARYTSCVQVKK